MLTDRLSSRSLLQSPPPFCKQPENSLSTVGTGVCLCVYPHFPRCLSPSSPIMQAFQTLSQPRHDVSSGAENMYSRCTVQYSTIQHLRFSANSAVRTVKPWQNRPYCMYSTTSPPTSPRNIAPPPPVAPSHRSSLPLFLRNVLHLDGSAFLAFLHPPQPNG